MAEPEEGKIVNFFKFIEDKATAGISRFIAALLIMITIGAFFGYFIAGKGGGLYTWLLLAPAVLGLFAFYNRGFAIFAFVLIALFVFL